ASALVALFAIAFAASAGTDTLSVPYATGFEGSAPGWTLTGGWHAKTSPQSISVIPAIADSLVNLPGGTSWPSPAEGTGVMALADDATGTYIEPYDPGAQVAGNGGESQSARSDTLTSPCFIAPSGETLRLSFDTWWEVEAFDIFGSDLLQVEYSSDGGANWTIIDILSVPGSTPSPNPDDAYSSGGIGAPGVWTPKTYSVNTGSGLPQFRFLFRSGTKDRNGFRGWFLDDLTVACEGLYEPYSAAATDDECSGVLVTWSDSSTANPVGYEVERRAVTSGVRDTIAVLTSTYLDTAATPGDNYEYRVRGASSCGLTGFTPLVVGSVPADPEPPTGVTASEGACDEIVIDWVLSAAPGTGYVIERAGVRVDTVGNGVTSYTDMSAAGGADLAYRVGTLGTCDPVYSAPDTGSRLADPPPVTFVSATDNLCDIVRVAWVAVANVSEYIVYRDSDSLATVDSLTTQYEDAAAESTQTYSYSVRTRTGCGISGVTTSDTGTRFGRAPSVVSCAASDNLCEEVVLTWTPSSDPGNLSGFAILRDGAAIDSVAPGITTYRDSSSLIDVPIYYEINAYNSCGYSVAACADSGLRETTPQAPTGVDASNDRCFDVRVSWTGVGGEIESYIVFRDGDSIATVDVADSTVYYDTAIDSAVVATYTVRSRSSCGLSATSISNGGRRTGAPPAAKNCVASDSLCGRVTVSWEPATAPGTVVRYVLFRGADSIDVKTAPPYSFTDTGGQANVAVQYEVRTWNECGYSVSAASDSGRALSAPGAPLDFTASQTQCGVVELNWQAPTSGGPVDGYRIVRGSPQVTINVSGDSLRYIDTAPPDGSIAYTLRAFNCEESAPVNATGNTVDTPPAPPAGCSLEQVACTGHRVLWEPSPDSVRGYIIRRNGADIDSVGPATSSYLDLGLGVGADYAYEVYSVNDCGRSSTACAAENRLPGPVASPAAGSCTATDDSCAGVWLDWQPAVVGQDVAWFKIYDAGTGARVDSIPSSARSYLDTTVPFGGERLYAIVAGNDCFTAAEGCTIMGSRPILPSGPVTCGASDNICDRIEVSWTSPSNGIEEGIFAFRVYRRVNTPSDPFVLIHTVQPPSIGANSYSDFTAEGGVSYLYRIASVNECGESSGSCTISGRRLRVRSGPTLTSPANNARFTALPVTLRWSEVSEISSYRIELSRDAAFTDLVRDTTVSNTSLVLGGIDFVSQYWWRVSSVNDCGAGTPSSVRSFFLDRAPGIDIVQGSDELFFGNGVDSLFADSVIVIENAALDSILWSFPSIPGWIAVEPAEGTLAPGARDTILVGVGEYLCGRPEHDTIFVASDPLPPGRENIPIAASLAPPPRPAGDFDWNCARDAADVGLMTNTILGLYAPSVDESLGADANRDGRIGVGDLVTLAGALVESGSIQGETLGGDAGSIRLDPSWAAKGENVQILRVTSDEPLRVLRATVRFETDDGGAGYSTGDGPNANAGGLPLLRAPEGAGEVLFAKRGGGRVDVLWYGLDRTEREIDLLLAEPASARGAAISVRVERLEALTASGTLVRTGEDAAVLAPVASPSRMQLSRPEPNPFARTSIVRFALPRTSAVRLHVYDIRGRLQRTLVNGELAAGAYTREWDGRGDSGETLASGVYFLRLESGRESKTERIILLR
ncbi:MAG: T9SS type A sorting domain-containing protein, partial [Gemmatimonadetes bacterium]|nr:T9SS type A sorting domain-containing protein [Gemmatimonadota bacterium]